MSAGRANSKRGDEHSWTNDHALVDRVPEGDINHFFTSDETTAEVAHGCEAGFDGRTRVFCRDDRVLRNVLVDFAQPALVVIAGKIEREMGVTVHKSWRKRGVAEIDHLCVWRRGQIAAGIDNFIALNNDNAVLDEHFRLSIEQTSCFQDNDFVRSLRRNCRGCSDEKIKGKASDGRKVHHDGIEILQPQSKAARSPPLLFHPRAAYFASHGYVFALVDVRGRGNSGGDFEPFAQEPHDGHDVVEWLAQQPFCDGKVAMWGGSYAGFDQWATAKEFPSHLATIVPAAAAHPPLDYPSLQNVGESYDVQWYTFTSGKASQQNLFGDSKFWRAKFLDAYKKHIASKPLDSFVGNP